MALGASRRVLRFLDEITWPSQLQTSATWVPPSCRFVLLPERARNGCQRWVIWKEGSFSTYLLCLLVEELLYMPITSCSHGVTWRKCPALHTNPYVQCSVITAITNRGELRPSQIPAMLDFLLKRTHGFVIPSVYIGDTAEKRGSYCNFLILQNQKSTNLAIKQHHPFLTLDMVRHIPLNIPLTWHLRAR